MSLSKALLRLRDEASRLNRIADEATRALTIVEAFLRRINVGIPMTIKLSNGWYLCFRKFQDEFGLFFDEDPNNEGAAYYRWQQASREEKILAAAHLQQLIDAILGEIDRQTSNTLDEETITEVARISKSIDQLEEGK